MKIKAFKIYGFILVLVILSITCQAIGQEVYHIDPNNIHGMVPDNYRQISMAKNLNDKIVILNKYNENHTVRISNDLIAWDQLTLKKNYFSVYKINNIYARIYTSATIFSTLKLAKGSVYTIDYDIDQQKWVILPYKF